MGGGACATLDDNTEVNHARRREEVGQSWDGLANGSVKLRKLQAQSMVAKGGAGTAGASAGASADSPVRHLEKMRASLAQAAGRFATQSPNSSTTGLGDLVRVRLRLPKGKGTVDEQFSLNEPLRLLFDFAYVTCVDQGVLAVDGASALPSLALVSAFPRKRWTNHEGEGFPLSMSLRDAGLDSQGASLHVEEL